MDVNPIALVAARYGRLLGVYTYWKSGFLPLPDDAKRLPIPFFPLPLVFSLLVFGGMRLVWPARGQIRFIQLLAMVFVFLLVTPVIPTPAPLHKPANG